MSKNKVRGIPIMPFGKYKGEYIASIPREYLEYLLFKCPLKPYLKRAIEIDLEGRLREQAGIHRGKKIVCEKCGHTWYVKKRKRQKKAVAEQTK